MDDTLTWDEANQMWEMLRDSGMRDVFPPIPLPPLPQLPMGPPGPGTPFIPNTPVGSDNFEAIIDMALDLMAGGKVYSSDDLKEAYLAGYDKGQGDGYNGLGFNPEEDEYVRSVEILKPT